MGMQDVAHQLRRNLLFFLGIGLWKPFPAGAFKFVSRCLALLERQARGLSVSSGLGTGAARARFSPGWAGGEKWVTLVPMHAE